MVVVHPAIAEIWGWLGEIPDPEIPVLSVVDLGIVRDVRWVDDELLITITPTYSGCPAMDVIVSDIRSSIHGHGIERLRLETRLSPAWTTEWLSEAARERLRKYGISPPSRLIPITAGRPACPHCGSQDTKLVSQYGSTPCKALYQCGSCLEPFDAFKRH